MPRGFISLKYQADFNSVFRFGRTSSTRTLRLIWLRNNKPQSRWGIIISKKNSKLAVVRNKLRRQIKGCLDLTKINQNIDGIIQVLKLPLVNQPIAEDLKYLLNKSRLM